MIMRSLLESSVKVMQFILKISVMPSQNGYQELFKSQQAQCHTVSFSVILSDGNIVKRHVDNIKARYNASTNATNGSEFDSAFQSGPEPTEDTQHSVIPDHPSTSNETTETTTEPSARSL